MTIWCHDLKLDPVSERLRRHLTLHGSLEDALECLPTAGADERLELDAGRISLVCNHSRIDVTVVADTVLSAFNADSSTLVLEISFQGHSRADAEAFIQCYRSRVNISSMRHDRIVH